MNLPLFTDTRKAIVHRFINGSIAVVAPDPCITQQLIHDESSSDSSFHMSSQRGTCKEDSTVTYVSSNDSTFDNSMSLFSKSSAVTDVTADHVGSADLFSSNGESSTEPSDSQHDSVEQALFAPSNDGANEISSSESERILKRKSLNRKASCDSRENEPSESTTFFSYRILCPSLQSLKTDAISISSTDFESDSNVF